MKLTIIDIVRSSSKFVIIFSKRKTKILFSNNTLLMIVCFWFEIRTISSTFFFFIIHVINHSHVLLSDKNTQITLYKKKGRKRLNIFFCFDTNYKHRKKNKRSSLRFFKEQKVVNYFYLNLV